MDINGVCHIVFCGRLEACFRGQTVVSIACPCSVLAKHCKSRTFQPLTVHTRPPFPFTFCFLPPVSSAPVSCGKGNRPACVPAAASLYRGYLSCVPSILLSVAVLSEKASCPIPAACSGVGTLPGLRDILSRSGSLRCFPCRGIPFRTVIHFSRCCPSMNYPKSTRKKCKSRLFARIAF